MSLLAQAAPQVTQADAPWWGVPLIAGLFALGGVLLAQGSSYFSDRRKAKREDALRWHTDVKALSVKVLAECGVAYRALHNREPSLIDMKSAADAIDTALATFAELKMIAPRVLIKDMIRLENAFVEYVTTDETDISRRDGLGIVYDHTRREFIMAVRRGLGGDKLGKEALDML